jgi:hypothetical protein
LTPRCRRDDPGHHRPPSEGFSQLPYNIFQGNHQGKLRVVKYLKVLHQILAHPVASLLQLVEGKARFLQKVNIPLDCPGRGLKLRAQPTAGDLLFFHENPEYLPQAEQLRACIFFTRHRAFLLQTMIITWQQ